MKKTGYDIDDTVLHIGESMGYDVTFRPVNESCMPAEGEDIDGEEDIETEDGEIPLEDGKVYPEDT